MSKKMSNGVRARLLLYVTFLGSLFYICTGDVDLDLAHDLDSFNTWFAGHSSSGKGLKVEAVFQNTNPQYSKTADGIRSRPDIYVIAKEDIAEGQAVVTVPASAMKSSRHAHLEWKGEKPTIVNKESVFLAAWILRERAKGAESSWAPYLSILPSFVPLPFLFDAELLVELEDKKLVEESLAVADDLLAIYDWLQGDSLANASLAEFRWAVSIVESRSFEGSGDDEKSFMLLPYVDLFNHGGHPHVVGEYIEGGVVFSTIRAVESGSEVFSSYGEKSNFDLLSNYGFVLPSNDVDYVVLFKDVEELVKTYVKEFATADMWKRTDIDWAEFIAADAVKEVETVLQSDRKNGGRVYGLGPSFDPSQGFTVWANGKILPHLIAALTAVWHYDMHRSEPSYKTLAEQSIHFGYNLRNISCSSLAHKASDLKYGIQAALGAVYETIQKQLNESSTSLEEDEIVLSSLITCQDTEKSKSSELAFCDGIAWTDLVSAELVVRYRSEKKRLLHGVNNRLLDLCPGSDESEIEASPAAEVEESADDDEEESLHDEL